MTPYKQILAMTKEAVQQALLPIRVVEMKKKAELEMATIDGKLVEMEQKIQEVCSKYPVDFNKLIDSLDEKALLERRRKQFEQIISEMFPA